MRNHQGATAFLHPVNPKEHPEYLEEVSIPMDLSTMYNKILSQDYEDLESFKHDVNLIKVNCEVYCETRYPHLPEVSTCP